MCAWRTLARARMGRHAVALKPSVDVVRGEGALDRAGLLGQHLLRGSGGPRRRAAAAAAPAAGAQRAIRQDRAFGGRTR